MMPPQTSIPAVTQPWWDQPVREPTAPALRVSVDQLVGNALQYSSYVHLVATEPRIRRTSILEEEAAFDWHAFLDATWDDVNEPVGNFLTTGNDNDRFIDRNWSVNSGVRRDSRFGGNMEVFQRVGSQQNNSQFLLPNPQATSQLELRYTQPILQGAGRVYNESRIVLAQIHANASSDELVGELQEHLVKVTDAYWELYRARAQFFQKLKVLHAAEATLAILEGRSELDAVQRQVLRAKATVETRRSEMARAYTSIRNAESRLRLLVNDPVLVQSGGKELAPSAGPPLTAMPLALDQSLYTALQNRPDISGAIRDVRAASVRLGVARDDILPKLDLVANAYVAGLASQTNVAQSFGSQFDAGRPTYSVGFLFEIPIGRRAALAQEQRRQWELCRTFAQFRLTVEEALTKVELACREVETNYREMVGKYQAMVAVTNEADYLSDRWRALPGADDSAVLLLENLLDAQERVADEEAALTLAMVRYAMSFVKLKQEMGTLLIVSPLQPDVIPAPVESPVESSE
jgi:outer membrane protein TolC